MTAQTFEVPVFVRPYGGTYIARCDGKQASCTMGEEHAARAAAKKRFGARWIALSEIKDGLFMAVVLEDLPDPYADGVEAAHSGKHAANCPYPYETSAGEQWMRGYQDGGGEQ